MRAAPLATIRRGVELGHYDLLAYVVMPNHVHMLVLPKISPSKFMKSLKGFTAREANLVSNRTGEPFWQAESYDHWVRNSDEGERIRGRHECLRHVGSIIRVKWVCLLHVIFWPGATIMEPYDGS